MAFANGYAYRMTAPVANPTAAGDRALDDIAFPAAFLLAQGRILEPDCSDYLVTTASGTTLRSSLNTAKTALYIDYPSMPQGRGEVYIYYGKAGASAPEPVTFWTQERYDAGLVAAQSVAESGTLIDNGFEDGVDGTDLGAAWVINGALTEADYDVPAFGAAIGTKCGWLRSSGSNQSVWPATGMNLTSDGAELRFWYYFENTTAERYMFGVEAARPVYIRFANDGKVYTYTQRSVTGFTQNNWTQVGTYSTGWHQFRIVLNFTAQTYQLSTRPNLSSAWTGFSATGGYSNIPMYSSSAITVMNSPRVFLNNANVNLWFDDMRYSNTGIVETPSPAPTTTAQVFPANHETSGPTDTGARYYLFGQDLEATYLQDTTPDTFYGAESVMKAGGTPTTLPGEQVMAEVPSAVLAATLPASSYVSVVNLYGRQTDANTYYRAEVLYRLDITSFSVQVRRNSTNTAVGTSVFGIMTSDRFWRFTASGTTLTVLSSADGETWTQRWTATDANIAGPGDWYTDPAEYESAGPVVNYHALVKFFEGGLPKGIVSDAKLHLYATPTGACDLRAYPLKTYGDYANNASYDYAVEPVRTGWSVQNIEQLPTWNTRFADATFVPAIPWLTPGATNANEIDTAVYSSLTIAEDAAAQYQAFDLPDATVQGWLGDDYSQGVLIKPNGTSGNISFPAPGQANGPVLVVEYSALAEDQLTGRKLSTDTHYGTNAYSHNRFSSCDSPHGFMVMTWPDADRTLGVALVSPMGRMCRVAKGTAPAGGRFSYNNPFFGIHYDESTGRYWVAGTDYASSSSFLTIGYSEPYSPTGWTWVTHSTLVIAKSSVIVKDGVAHIAACDAVNRKVLYLTYTIAGGFSSTTELYTATFSGTQRGLAAGIDSATAMTGSGTISANGSIADYPAFGALLIGSEFFWYTGKSGQDFTGVTRACYRTTAATHATGATIECMMGLGIPTYTAMSYDPVRDCLHLLWSHNRGKYSGVGAVSPGVGEYQASAYLRHYLADAANVWKEESDTLVSLPMNPSNAHLITPATTPHFPFSITCNSQGDVLVCYRIYSSPDDIPLYNRTGYGYLTYGQTAFTNVMDSVGTYRMWGMGVDLGESNMAMTYLTNATNDITTANGMAIGLVRSYDSGASWVSPEVIDSHAWESPYGWASGISEKANVAGLGLAYINHMGMYGGLYLTTVQLIELAYRPRRQRMAALGGF